MDVCESQTITAATMTPDEIAALTGVCARTVRRACERGELPATRIGRRWVISRELFMKRFTAPSSK